MIKWRAISPCARRFSRQEVTLWSVEEGNFVLNLASDEIGFLGSNSYMSKDRRVGLLDFHGRPNLFRVRQKVESNKNFTANL